MSMKPIIFCGFLFLLGTRVSSQTTENSIEEAQETYDATDVTPPNNGTTFSPSATDNINVPENDTEVLESISTGAGNKSTEATVTHAPYYDFNVTEDSTPCDDQICENGGTCVVTSDGGLSCSCPSNYVGNRCETFENCTMDNEGILCKNGACVYDQSRKQRYCKCFLGHYWDSLRTECRLPEEPCFPNPCHPGGSCTAAESGEYQCSCPERFIGRNCEIEDTCSLKNHDNECENGYCVIDTTQNRKICKCFDGFYLDTLSMQCKKISLPCEPNPCMNNGKCSAVSTTKYNCTCPDIYTGDRCEILNLCKPDSSGQICKNGMCKQDGVNSKRCLCSKGYYYDEKSNECKEVSPPCVPNPCANDGICNVISSSEFNCSCSEDYYGKQCTFVNKCIREGNAFCRNAECIMKDDNSGYICRCPPKEYFDYGSRKCKGVDVCPLFIIKENAVCKNNTVTCFNNFKENEETGLCEPNFCETKGCPAEGMICEENKKNPENYKCSCKKGYSFDGKSCNPAFCTVPGLNNCEQVCETEDDGFSCKCHDSFILKADNKTCEYSGNSTCLNKTCDIGQCVIQGGKEKCICPPGYDEVNGKCRDKCSAGILPPGVCPDNRCEATRSGFRCKCEGKYKLSPDNVTCTVKQLCSENEYGWKLCSKRNAVCLNDWNQTLGFTCKCPASTVRVANGICQDICAVEENTRKCSQLGAACDLNSDFSFTCRCPPSFRQSKQGAPCNILAKFSYMITLPVPKMYYAKKQSPGIWIQRSFQDVPLDERKLWKDVTDSMRELYEAFEKANVLLCIDVGDFLLCTVELQFGETNLESLNRIKDPLFCISNARRKDNLCLIPPSLVLRKDKVATHVSFERTDPCSELIKADLCESSTRCTSSLDNYSFSCTCKSGFIAHKRMYPLRDDTDTVIETCNDFDECAESNPCPKSTTCSNTIGGYNCFCRPGYRTINDSSDPRKEGCIHLCDHNPCLHGTCKAAGDHNFECTCEAGFTGRLCNYEDKNYKDAKVNTIIVGAVLGGILLIVIIIFASKITRTGRKFGHESGQLILGSTEMTERRQIRGGIFNDAFERE